MSNPADGSGEVKKYSTDPSRSIPVEGSSMYGTELVRFLQLPETEGGPKNVDGNETAEFAPLMKKLGGVDKFQNAGQKNAEEQK